MPNLSLTGDQLEILKAAWAYFMEADDQLEIIHDALETPPEQRGLDEAGDEKDDYHPEEDPVYKRIEELDKVVMNLE